MGWDPAEDAWLSGFADGEGCFQIRPSKRSWQPQFSISLRADDGPVLHELHARFGGRMNFLRLRTSAPQWAWSLSARRDLPGLVAYFDRFPLRAKKQRDYLIWREAVSIYLASGGLASELPDLARALRGGRVYASEEKPLAASPQLRVV